MTKAAREEVAGSLVNAYIWNFPNKINHQMVAPEGDDQHLDQIIARCLSLLMLVLAYDAKKPLSEVTIGSKAEEAKEANSLLATIRTTRNQLDTSLDVLEGLLVKRCRELDQSWAEISRALRLTPQGAYKRAKQMKWVDEWDSSLED